MWSKNFQIKFSSFYWTNIDVIPCCSFQCSSLETAYSDFNCLLFLEVPKEVCNFNAVGIPWNHGIKFFPPKPLWKQKKITSDKIWEEEGGRKSHATYGQKFQHRWNRLMKNIAVVDNPISRAPFTKCFQCIHIQKQCKTWVPTSTVWLFWVPGHSEIIGNKIVDVLARGGNCSPVCWTRTSLRSL